MCRSVTLFPVPDGPISTVISPLGMRQVTPSRTRSEPNDLVTDMSSITGSLFHVDSDCEAGRSPKSAAAGLTGTGAGGGARGCAGTGLACARPGGSGGGRIGRAGTAVAAERGRPSRCSAPAGVDATSEGAGSLEPGARGNTESGSEPFGLIPPPAPFSLARLYTFITNQI